MSVFLIPHLLILSLGSFSRYDLSYEDVQIQNLLGNNLEISIYGDLNFGRTLLIDGALQMSLSIQHCAVKSIRSAQKYKPNEIQLILEKNTTTFNQSLLRVIENTKYSAKIVILLWPEICSNNSEPAGILRSYVWLTFVNVNLNANIYIMFRIRNGNLTNYSISLWEAYSVAGKTLYNKLEMESKNSINWFSLNNKIVRRKNTMQGILRAISVNDSSWENETKYRLAKPDIEIQFESGYAVYMLWVIRDLFNFRIEAMKGNWTAIDEKTSRLVGNGQIVASDQADISISQQSLNFEWAKRGLFLLHPTNSAGLRLYFIQPEMSQYRDIFVTPFAKDLWITIIGVFVLIVLTVKIFGWVLHHYEVEEDEKDTELVESVVVWSVAIIAQQGFHVEPSSLSIRIVFLFGYMTGLVCFIAYSAQIVSTLSVKSLPIHQAEDVLNGPFQLYANPNNTAKAVINHILKEHKRTSESVYMEEREAIRRILKYTRVMQALVAEPDIFYTEAWALKCTNKQICDKFSSLHLHRVPIKGGMFVGKHSPYIEWFNYAIILMLERGLNNRFVSNYIRRSWVICLEEKNAFVQPVKVTDIISAFEILFVGYVISLILLTAEVLVKRRWNKKQVGSGFIS